MRDRLSRNDWIFLAVCLAITLASLAIVARYWNEAFPEASIDFRYDRNSSRVIAEKVLAQQRINVGGMKHAVVFDADDSSRIFLERSVGLERTRELVPRDVRIWYWHHRWFKPLQEEEYSVDIAPTGEIVSMTQVIPESRAMAVVDPATARKLAEDFLQRAGTPLATVDLVSQSDRDLPRRVQRIFTFESKSVKPAGARYQHVVTVDGGAVSSYGQGLKVPDEWLRSYRELRSKNAAAGSVDAVFMIVTMIAALVVFIVRLRRGDMSIRFLLATGAVAFVLVGGVTANSIPSAFASYDTTTSYPAFVAQIVFVTILQSFGTAMLLIVICGAGEVLYRQRLPQQLAMPRLWNRRALASKRVFRSIILGYTLVGFFIAYQTAFYIIAAKFGAWSPADVPYDDMLNTAIPWVAVLFAGFFPAMSEEFLSRAFSIPLFQRVLKSRIAAIVIAGFIWGFGHAGYPNQPFYIRGVEVGIAGIVLGFLMDRYGLLALLIWHYTVDAVYTALLLFRSGNTYYIASGAIASAVFAIPLVLSVALYFRNRGFIPDDDLTNATMPVPRAVEVTAAGPEVPLPPPIGVSRQRIALCVAAVIAAVALVLVRGPSPSDVVDYRIDDERAKTIATLHLASLGQKPPERKAALAVSGFRNWERGSGREEGGSPGGFDSVAATYMIRNGMAPQRLIQVMRNDVPAATWIVRFFTPQTKTEYFVEVDPRTSRVVGYHKYADENAPGPRLERDAALLVALSAFKTYGVSDREFDLKEALAFQQPNRRDWLFHFEAQQPLSGVATRRATVRVMGNEVTQFAPTVKVPESIYRESEQQTIVNVLAGLLKIIGVVAALALVVTGFILATRHGHVPWKRAARVTLLLAIVPVASQLARYEPQLFSYSTSVAWDTFRLTMVTDFVRNVGLQILMIFVAVAGLAAAVPYAFRVISREGRRRFGQSAAVATLTAVAVFAAARELLRLIATRFRTFAAVEEIGIADAVALPFPAAFEMAQAVISAIVVSGVVALLMVAVSGWRGRRAAPVVLTAILFCTLLDTGTTLQQLPFSIAAALLLSLLVWFIARHVLNGNPLAWPLAAFATSLLQSGVEIAQNSRVDLRINGAILVVAAAAVLVWALSGPRMQPGHPLVHGDA
jgi:membrane protease YdiL (CAAX protease family)